nr:RNA-dependent RNA polymerase [Picobirnavirus sp.]
MTDIDHYYEDIRLSSAPLSRSAVAAVKREWSVANGLRIRNEDKTVQSMKLSTNSGSPYFTKRNRVIHETIPSRILISGNEVTQHLPNYHGRGCAVIGWRGQEGGPSKEDVKQRVVWMFPFAVNVQELRVYQPLIEAAQKFNLVPAWVSMEAVDQRVTRMFDTKSNDDLVVCTDFSKFDQHFNHSLQDVARELIATLFKGGISKEWLAEIYPIKYMIPIMYNWGQIRTGLHGMASGSGGTNADETLAHRTLQYEAAIRAGAWLNPNSQCLGDDGMLTYPGITVEDVVETYRMHGLEMNDSKQYSSTQDCVYLRRWHHKNYRMANICVGVYSTMRALGRLRYLERYYDPEIWGPKMVALRQLSIIENVKWHPLRDQFAEFCMKRDKYRLGIDIPGFLDNIADEARKAIDYMPDFLGYTKTLQSDGNDIGIANWWIIQYLKSK